MAHSPNYWENQTPCVRCFMRFNLNTNLSACLYQGLRQLDVSTARRRRSHFTRKETSEAGGDRLLMVQTSIHPIKDKYITRATALLNALSDQNEKGVRMVITGLDWFMTDHSILGSFFGRFRGIHWIWTIYLSEVDRFVHIDITQSLGHFVTHGHTPMWPLLLPFCMRAAQIYLLSHTRLRPLRPSRRWILN